VIHYPLDENLISESEFQIGAALCKQIAAQLTAFMHYLRSYAKKNKSSRNKLENRTTG
jgi:hypothetical protein